MWVPPVIDICEATRWFYGIFTQVLQKMPKHKMDCLMYLQHITIVEIWVSYIAIVRLCWKPIFFCCVFVFEKFCVSCEKYVGLTCFYFQFEKLLFQFAHELISKFQSGILHL